MDRSSSADSLTGKNITQGVKRKMKLFNKLNNANGSLKLNVRRKQTGKMLEDLRLWLLVLVDFSHRVRGISPPTFLLSISLSITSHNAHQNVYRNVYSQQSPVLQCPLSDRMKFTNAGIWKSA